MQPRPTIKLNLYLVLERKTLTPEVLLRGQPLLEFPALRDLKFETLQDEVFSSSVRQAKDVGSIFGKYKRSDRSPSSFPVHYKQI